MNYKSEANGCLERAVLLLEQPGVQPARYAALELRFCIEAFVYHRLQHFVQELPSNEQDTWQPRKGLELLLQLDPAVTIGSTIMLEGTVVGRDEVLTLSDVKSNYDALGSFLHTPTLKQLKAGKGHDEARIRTRCKQVVEMLSRVLAATVVSTFGMFDILEACARCGRPVRRRVPSNTESYDATCVCGAIYDILECPGLPSVWQMRRVVLRCLKVDCHAEMVFAADQVKLGTKLRCPECDSQHVVETTYSLITETQSGPERVATAPLGQPGLVELRRG